MTESQTILINIAERRIKPRVACEYQAIVQGVDLDGNMYEDSATLANLSASGLFMWVTKDIKAGSLLSVVILLRNKNIDLKTRKLVTKGVVIRKEQLTEGKYGIAVMFTYHRFL